MPTLQVLSRRNFLKFSAVGLAGLNKSFPLFFQSGNLSAAALGNPIVAENNQPGSTGWNITNTANDTARQIKGYASATSINKGTSIDFHVSVNPAQTFTMQIYRIGWYNGTGGRLMQTVGPLNGTNQPVPTPNALGTVACSWPVSYTLNIPLTWTTGTYLVLLVNSQGWQNYIPFVVRDDNGSADLIFQCSVTTYQAYNNFGGKSLYPEDSTNGSAARKVSFDRPYDDLGADHFYDWEMPLVRFIEKNGYNVSYCTNLDLHLNPDLMDNHKAFLSTGHDEYWTMAMYDNALGFRNKGRHLAFFGANAVYWQIRLENSEVGVPNRIITGYKSYYLEDPQYPGPTTTYLWRELPPGSPGSGFSRPENQLIGVMFDSWRDGNTGQPFVVDNSSHWVYAGTGFTNGMSVPGIVGYEWDKRFNNGLESAGLVQLSNSPVIAYDGTQAFSNTTIYQATSGAWVFATGSIYWAYGLDFCGEQVADLRNAGIQQMTLNVLNRFLSDTPSLPVVNSLSLTTIGQMENAFTLTVNGSNFGSGAVVNWKSSPCPTTFISNGQLTTQISAADILTAGTFPVTVTNPDGKASNAINFVVTVPVVTSNTDGGESLSSTMAGTLSYALKHVHRGDTIIFSGLGSANRITVSGKLPVVPAGVILDGGGCGTSNVVIDGNGVEIDGLVVLGNVTLKNMRIQNFGGRQLVNNYTMAGTTHSSNRLECTIVQKKGT